MKLPGSDTTDRVFRDPQNQISDFVFDERVASVFTDMIRRSVPAYETVVPMTGLLAARHVPDGGRIYDLGCSLGATTLAVLAQLGDADCEIVAVDNSAAMLERARTHVTDPRVNLVEGDVLDTPIDRANVVLMNYTLQFIDPDQRQSLLARIHAGLAPGGVLILSEKVRFDDPDTNAYFNETHLAYKRANGYSDLEVSRKRSALENVMIVDTIDIHTARLNAAGFSTSRIWFQCLNWAGFIAWR